MIDSYIALGSNLGDRLSLLRQAVSRLREIGTIASASGVYETAPVGYLKQPSFLNAVVQLRTDHAPSALLRALLVIETELGRTRSFPNAPRTMDLDLLLYGEQTISSTDLIVPHPRLHERAFVLVPLAELAPGLIHPTTGRTITALLESLGDTSGVDLYESGSLTSPDAPLASTRDALEN